MPVKPVKPQAGCGRIRRLLDGTEVRGCLYHGTPCVCGVSLLPSRPDRSRLVSILAPSVPQRQPDSHGRLGAGVRQSSSGPPAERRRHDPCPVDQLGGGHACDAMAWALAGSEGGQQGLHPAGVLPVCCWCHSDCHDATGRPHGCECSTVRLGRGGVDGGPAPPRLPYSPTQNDSAGAGMPQLSLISLRGQ